VIEIPERVRSQMEQLNADDTKLGEMLREIEQKLRGVFSVRISVPLKPEEVPGFEDAEPGDLLLEFCKLDGAWRLVITTSDEELFVLDSGRDSMSSSSRPSLAFRPNPLDVESTMTPRSVTERTRCATRPRPQVTTSPVLNRRRILLRIAYRVAICASLTVVATVAVEEIRVARRVVVAPVITLALAPVAPAAVNL
jgi:hypothetical protein